MKVDGAENASQFHSKFLKGQNKIQWKLHTFNKKNFYIKISYNPTASSHKNILISFQR